MPEENLKPDESLEQKLEIESQAAQSAEHKEAEQVKANEILSETVDRPEPPPAENAGKTVLPVPPVALSPESKSVPADAEGRFYCSVCGKGPWDKAKARDTHVRFQHEVPAKKLEQEKRKQARASSAKANGDDTIASPDFSDIDTGPRIITPEPDLLAKRYESMANMTFDMSTGLLSRIFGPEWQASSPDERIQVVYAIQKYYESVQLPDIPPGYMLCFVCAAYAAPRLAAQPTKTKLQSAWLWLKMKFSRRQPNHLLRVVQPEKKSEVV